MDYHDLLKGRRHSQAQVQDLRRRMNHQPAVHDAQATGDAARQRADEAHNRYTNAALDAAHTRASDAHSRLTNVSLDNAHVKAEHAHGRASNAAIDAAHTRAEAAYRKDGSDFAAIFRSDRSVGTTQATFLRHSPPDRDQISVAQNAAGEVLFFNDTSGRELLRLDRFGNVSVPAGKLTATGEFFPSGGIQPNVSSAGVQIDGGQGVVFDHNFGSYPPIPIAWLAVGAGQRAPLSGAPRNGVQIDWMSTTQIRIANLNAAGTGLKTVGVWLFK